MPRQVRYVCRTLILALLVVTPLLRSPSNAAEPNLLTRVDGFPDWVTSVVVSGDGTLIAAGSFESARLITPDGDVTAEWKPGSGFVRALALTPDNKTLIAGGYKDVTLWDVEQTDSKPKQIGRLQGHRGYVEDLSLSLDGTHLASCGADGTVRVWDLKSLTETLLIEGDGTPLSAVAFSPDGTLLATAAGDETRLSQPGTVSVWNAATGAHLRDGPEHKLAATSVAFAADGSFLLSGSLDERVHVVDPTNGESLGFIGAHTRPVNCLAVTGDDKIAISGSGGRFQGKNEVKLWTPTDGTIWASFEPHEGKVNDLSVSADGRLLVTASDDKTVALIDLTPILKAAGFTVTPAAQPAEDQPKSLRAGIIGLDTSHVIGFTKLLNADDPPPELAGCRVVAAYPPGSPDIESSVSRVPQYTEEIQTLGVEIVDSIPALLERVDVVLLETNDGRPHLEQVLPVLRAGKPVFVDKPIAGSLVDAIVIQRAAEKYGVPLMSSSVMRFYPDFQDVRSGAIGEVTGCDTFSPASLEPTHPDFFWYGIHGVEALFTVMGTGCETVTRTSTDDFDVCVGRWSDGRIGTFRGLRAGQRGFGGTAFGTKGIRRLERPGGYDRLVAAIVKFFKSGKSPVPTDETLAVYAFMEAADESKRQGGATIEITDILKPAQQQADKKLQTLLKEDNTSKE